MDEEDNDRELAAAIEASLRSQTAGGREQSEDELLAMAIEQSRLEEEARQRGEPVPTAAPVAPPAGAPMPRPPANDFDGDSSIVDDNQFGFDNPGMHPGIGGMHPGMAGMPLGMPGMSGMNGMAGMEGVGGLDQAVGGDDEMPDASLAAAIEASYAAQTEHGMVESEQTMIEQAIQMSKQDDESRQRAALREQQEMELQESMLMDRMREEEEQRARREEEELRNQAEQQREADQAAVAADLEAKRGRVPPEPPAGEPGRLVVQIRLPDGRRIRRAFRSSDTVGQVYDYTDVEGGEALAGVKYRLVETMPRRVYEDRNQTAQDAGFTVQCSLLVESV